MLRKAEIFFTIKGFETFVVKKKGKKIVFQPYICVINKPSPLDSLPPKSGPSTCNPTCHINFKGRLIEVQTKGPDGIVLNTPH